MKSLIVIAFSVMMLSAADGPTKNAPAQKPAAKSVEIPAGAVESEPGTWHYTGTDGKNWIYRKTPFGVARIEDTGAAAPGSKATSLRAAAPAAPAEGNIVKATEAGDSIRFERPGPFGPYRWESKKSELNEMEKAAWDRERSRTATGQD
jgi:hypothetical protein